MKDKDLPIQHSKYHGCWCPGSLRRQGISNHDIYYVEPDLLKLLIARLSRCISVQVQHFKQYRYVVSCRLKKQIMLYIAILFVNRE